MLVEKADGTWRELLDRLFAADSQELLESGFAALEAESVWRRAQAAKQEGEHRRKTHAPVHDKGSLGVQSAEEAAADWNATILAARERAGAAKPDGDGV